MIPLHFEDICFKTASEAQMQTGLLGFITATINGVLHVEGLTLRRTEKGEIRLAFPERADRHGVTHHYLLPLNDEVRRHIEDQILIALGHREEATG